jgi:hypothetical protein
VRGLEHDDSLEDVFADFVMALISGSFDRSR